MLSAEWAKCASIPGAGILSRQKTSTFNLDPDKDNLETRFISGGGMLDSPCGNTFSTWGPGSSESVKPT